MDMIYAALPAVLFASILVIVERLSGAPKTDWLRNVQAWLLQFSMGMAILPLISHPNGFALLDARTMPVWLAFPIFLVAHDFAEYAFHRAQHFVPILWTMHQIHHSDPEMSALTTQRHFWGDQVLKALTVWPLAAMVIAPTPGMIVAASFACLWNFVAHARLPIDFGRWSWIINTPAYHRRHHSTLPEHFNSNFAAMFPIFDVIFGSYRRPDGFPPTGLPRKPDSFAELALWPVIDREADQAAAPAEAINAPA